MKKVIRNSLSLCCFAILAIVTVAVAESMTIEETIKSRQHSYRDLGGAFKSLRDQLRAKKPNIYIIQPTVMQMNDLADIQHLWFPPGSGPESGFETEAKAEIWSDPEGFAQAQKNFAEAFPKLIDLAYANDVAGLKAYYREFGQTCKGCHDKYREEDD